MEKKEAEAAAKPTLPLPFSPFFTVWRRHSTAKQGIS
jgi:hypothetical protein